MRALVIGAVAPLAAGLLGCKRDKGMPPTPPPPDVSVIEPAVVPVQDAHEYNGHLNTTHNVEVRARVKGILKQVHFKDGRKCAVSAAAASLPSPANSFTPSTIANTKRQ